MKKHVKLLAYLALIGLALTGCSSSDDPGDEEYYNGPPLPSDAATIDSFNAINIATKSLDTFDLLGNTLPNAVSNSSGTTFNCITGYYTDSWTADITGISGQMDFYSCAFADPLTLSGRYNYSAAINNSDLTQTGDANNFSLDYDGALYTLNVEFSVDLNIATGAYSIITDFSLSGIADQGLLFNTVTPLTGTYPSGVDSGQVLVSGANNTRLRITVINNGADIYVELDEGEGSGYNQNWTINLVSASSPAPAP